MFQLVVCLHHSPKSATWNDGLFTIQMGFPNGWRDANQVPASMRSDCIIAREPRYIFFEMYKDGLPTVLACWAWPKRERGGCFACLATDWDAMRLKHCGFSIVNDLTSSPVIDVFQFLFGPLCIQVPGHPCLTRAGEPWLKTACRPNIPANWNRCLAKNFRHNRAFEMSRRKGP